MTEHDDMLPTTDDLGASYQEQKSSSDEWDVVAKFKEDFGHKILACRECEGQFPIGQYPSSQIRSLLENATRGRKVGLFCKECTKAYEAEQSRRHSAYYKRSGKSKRR